MEHEFDKISISKLVLKLGVPAMLAQFFNILYSIVDRAYVGHMETGGDIALASIGICAPLLTAITAFSSLVGIGGASVMSISIGRKDDRSARLAINNANILLFCIAVIITVLSLFFCKIPPVCLGVQRHNVFLCKRIFQNLCNRHSCGALWNWNESIYPCFW